MFLNLQVLLYLILLLFYIRFNKERSLIINHMYEEETLKKQGQEEK